MARNGSNLSQVFISNADVVNTTAMSALAVGSVGIYPNGTNSSAVTAMISGTVNPVWLVDSIQVAQGRTAGNPLASPIIRTAEITRLAWRKYVLPVKAITADVTITSTANATYGLKIIMKYPGNSVNDYDEYANPSVQLMDRAGEIRNYEFTSTAGTADGIADGLIAAINADPYAIVTATQPTGAAHIQLEAKEKNTSFQVIDSGVTALAPTTLVNSYAPTTGIGDPDQVLSDEKKTQGKYGYHNRIHLPTTFETYSTAGHEYHMLDITYRHNHPNSTGIAPAGELNTIRTYIGAASELAAGSTTLDTIFALPATSVADNTHIFHGA